MLSREHYMDILCKYPELIEPGYDFHERQANLYGQEVDMLLVDVFNKRLVVYVRTAPIENEHVGEIISRRDIMLEGETEDVNVMLVADRVPKNLQTSLTHQGVAWKEINTFQIKEHLMKNNDLDMLELLER